MEIVNPHATLKTPLRQWGDPERAEARSGVQSKLGFYAIAIEQTNKPKGRSEG